jgi:hypothetical protein
VDVIESMTSATTGNFKKIDTNIGTINTEVAKKANTSEMNTKFTEVASQLSEKANLKDIPTIPTTLTSNGNTVRIDITGQTLDLNTLTLNSGTQPDIIEYKCTTGAGSSNIRNTPFTNSSFILTVESVRRISVNDYVTKQTITYSQFEAIRYCTNGTWTSWLTEVNFNAMPVDKELVIVDGTYGGVKSSGKTISDLTTIKPIQFGLNNTSTEKWVKLCTVTINSANINKHLKVLIQDRFRVSELALESWSNTAYNSGVGYAFRIISLEGNGFAPAEVILGQKIDTTTSKTYWDIWVKAVTWNPSICYKVLMQYSNASTPTDFVYYNDVYSATAPVVADGYDLVANPSPELYINGFKVWHQGNDGSNSGMDADMLEGKHASDFAPSGFGLGTACTNASGDWNNYYAYTGFYMGSGMLNSPPNIVGTNSWWYVQVCMHNSSYCLQIANDFNNVATYHRTRVNGIWSAWKRISDEVLIQSATPSDTSALWVY